MRYKTYFWYRIRNASPLVGALFLHLHIFTIDGMGTAVRTNPFSTDSAAA